LNLKISHVTLSHLSFLLGTVEMNSENYKNVKWRKCRTEYYWLLGLWNVTDNERKASTVEH
jgi:hypothetical protein